MDAEETAIEQPGRRLADDKRLPRLSLRSGPVAYLFFPDLKQN